MNDILFQIRFSLDSVENNPFVKEYTVLKCEYTTNKFQLRLRITLLNHSVLYTNEYVETTRKYAFQWQTADNKWLVRWNNVPHFPKLASFPHHRHDYRSETEIVTDSFDITLAEVLAYIQNQLQSYNP